MALGREINFFQSMEINLNDASIIEILNKTGQSNIENIILIEIDEFPKWISNSTVAISEQRSKFKSAYIRWCLAINGLFLGNEKYSTDEWKSTNLFYVNCLRNTKGGKTEATHIIEFIGDEAALAHHKTISMIAGWGIIDLFGQLEEFIIRLFCLFLDDNPNSIIQGEEYRNLRQLYRNKDNSEHDNKKWIIAWEQRKNDWQRKKIYDGLDRVFLNYFKQSGLQKPDYCIHYEIDQWCEIIKAISLLRNNLIHNQDTVSSELSDFCNNKAHIFWKFDAGQELSLELIDLQVVELFLYQLLTALNISLVNKHMENNFR